MVRNNQRMVQSKKSVYVALLSIGLILIVGISLASKQQANLPPGSTFTPTSEESNLIANTKDGVCVNSEHGYKFTFHENIFQYRDPKKTNETEWINMDPLDSNFDGYSALFLYTKVINDYGGEYANYENTLYKKVIDLPVGGKIYDSQGSEMGMKLSDLKADNAMGVYYNYKVPESSESTKNHVYRAEWLKNDKIFAIIMLSQSQETLKNNREMFNHMVSTFEFFEPDSNPI